MRHPRSRHQQPRSSGGSRPKRAHKPHRAHTSEHMGPSRPIFDAELEIERDEEPHAQRASRSHANPFTQGGRLTLYGRKPVLEALREPSLMPQKLVLAYHSDGDMIHEITQLARDVGLPIERMSAMELSRISKQGKQDQGVALDVQAPHHRALSEALEELKPRPESSRPRVPPRASRRGGATLEHLACSHHVCM